MVLKEWKEVLLVSIGLFFKRFYWVYLYDEYLIFCINFYNLKRGKWKCCGLRGVWKVENSSCGLEKIFKKFEGRK